MHQNVWRIGATGAIACAIAIGAAAQPPDPSQTRGASTNTMNKVTVTGCVQRADSAPTGTSGSTSASTDTKFILANATASSGSSSSPAGTSGATTPSTASATASSYRLDADDSKLTPHIGHKVEISGTLESASSSSSTPSTSSTTPGAASSMSSPKLKVDTVKMISSTCSD